MNSWKGVVIDIMQYFVNYDVSDIPSKKTIPMKNVVSVEYDILTQFISSEHNNMVLEFVFDEADNGAYFMNHQTESFRNQIRKHNLPVEIRTCKNKMFFLKKSIQIDISIEQIRASMKEKGIRSKELASVLQITPEHLCRVLNGKVHMEQVLCIAINAVIERWC